MTTFVWNDLTISVGEMSRTDALDVCRQFDVMKTVYTAYDDLMSEADILCAISAPTTIKQGTNIIRQSGAFTVTIDDDTEFDVSLPITRESFMKLPMSLTAAWITASLQSNDWFIDTLKKAFGLTRAVNSVQELGNAPLPDLIATSQPMTTIGA